MDEFITPKNHIHFLAKKLFENCGEIIDGSIAYLEPKGGGPIELHTHEHDHIFIVTKGKAKIILGEEEKYLLTNDSFLVQGNIPHSVWNDTDETTIMIGISVKKQKQAL